MFFLSIGTNSVDLLRIIFVGLRYDVMWTVLRLYVCLGNVLSHDAHAKELYSAKEHDDTYQ